VYSTDTTIGAPSSGSPAAGFQLEAARFRGVSSGLIRAEHGRDLKRPEGAAERVAGWLSRRGFRGVLETAFRVVAIASRRLSAGCLRARFGLAEDQHVLVRDYMSALPERACATDVEHLPERRAHD
jgi:hypothetical protein